MFFVVVAAVSYIKIVCLFSIRKTYIIPSFD